MPISGGGNDGGVEKARLQPQGASQLEPRLA